MCKWQIQGLIWFIGIQIVVIEGALNIALADEITRPLRDLAEACRVRIGVAVDADALENDTVYREMVAREFNVITPENAMKFGPLRPAPGEYDFSKADAIVSFAEEHGMRVRGHTLVWHNQLPPWLLKGDYSQDELRELLREHIQTVVRRYRGKVFAWDVVNEALDTHGSLRKTIWLDRLGPEYIELAFRWARESDPDALLFYNDYNHEGGGKPSKAIYTFVKDMKNRGVPIDGVGLQMHLSLNHLPDIQHIVQAIRRFGDIGLQVHITELDIKIPSPTDKTALEKQAKMYGELIRVVCNEPACTDIVIWGLDDGHSWVPDKSALVFDNRYQPKPAYHAMVAVFEEIQKKSQHNRVPVP